MSRKPGEPTVEPEAWEVLQVDEIELRNIGDSFVRIADDLRAAGELIKSAPIKPTGVDPKSGNETIFTEEDVAKWGNDSTYQAEELLTALKKVRRNWAYWERVAAEYAMKELGMTQRRVAAALGVSTATVNKWSQNPVGFNLNELGKPTRE